jgi:hypothetical protein
MSWRWPLKEIFVGILVFSSFCSAIRLEIGFIGISVTHLFMPIIFGFAIALHKKSAKIFPIQTDNASIFLYFIWFVSIVSTLLYSGFPVRSITGAVNFSSFIFLYLMSSWIFTSIEANRLVKILINSASASAYIGVFSLVIAIVTNQGNIGATYDHISQFNIASITKPIPSIRSFSIEPNLFGIITASVLSIYLAIYLTWDKTNRIVGVITLLGLTLIFSYTRSAFLGFSIGVITMAFISKKARVVVRTFQYGALFGILLALLIIILPDENSFKLAISYKLGIGMFDLSSGTAIPRLVAIQEGFDGFIKSPLIGNGIFSANNVFINPHTSEITGTAGPIGWLNGLFIQALHDSGLLGLLGWVCFFFFLLHLNYRMFRKLPPSLERSIVLGFIGGNIVILVGSQASSVVWISFPFVFWAINLSILKYYSKQLNSVAK